MKLIIGEVQYEKCPKRYIYKLTSNSNLKWNELFKTILEYRTEIEVIFKSSDGIEIKIVADSTIINGTSGAEISTKLTLNNSYEKIMVERISQFKTAFHYDDISRNCIIHCDGNGPCMRKSSD